MFSVDDLKAVAGRSQMYQSIMKLNDISVSQSYSNGNSGETHNWGGWANHMNFGVAQRSSNDGNTFQSLAFGNAPGTNPVGTGGATWNGVMIGNDVSATESRGDSILGDATISIDDLANPDVDVAFTGIYNLFTSEGLDDMTWDNLAVANGAFGDGSGSDRISGNFYGPNQEEVGGIFERDDILGAFGAKR